MDEQTLRELVEKRYSISQIQQFTGRGEHAVRRALKSFGLKTVRHIARDPTAKVKTCRVCSEVKPIEEFPITKVLKGITYRRNHCTPCCVATKAARKHELAVWMEEFKKTLSCSRCGNDDFRVLEFHHTSGDKEFNLGEGPVRGYSRERILNEARKCEPLCANCHRILHYEERWGEGKSVRHSKG